MLNRFFGKKKKDAPQATLDDAATSLDKRGGAIDERIAKLDSELLKFKKQMATMKKGPARNAVQKRALAILKQKKMYEKQRDAVYNQQFNIDQTKFAQESIKDTQTMVSAMKNANKELKKEFKAVDIDDIEDLHDDMEDMMEMHDEIQEVMSRAYGVPEDIDEDELLDELNALEDEVGQEEAESDQLPAYLVSAASATKKLEAPAVPNKQLEEEDEFGLPRVPASNVHA